MTEQRFEEIDRRLESLEAEIVGFRERLQTNSASVTSLERLGSELLDIAQLHQRALRVSQQRADEDRAEIRRIWEYLLGQQRNGNGDRS